MTSPEVREAIDSGRDLIVVPFGAIEQHGPHMPIGTDAILGDEIGYRAADRLDAIFAPTVRVGCSSITWPSRGRSPSEATLAAVAVDIVLSLARHGFRRIFLLPTHFGNFAPLAEAASTLESHDLGEAVVINPTDYFAVVLEDATLKVSEELGVSAGESGAHCGEWETSIMRVLRPDLVHMDRAEAGYTGDLREGLAKVFADGVDVIAANGVIGDPRKATPSHGERYIERLVEVAAETAERGAQAQAG